MFCVHWILLSLLSVKYTCLVYNPGLLASLITWKVLKLWEYSPHKNSLSKFNFKIKLLKINVQTLNVFRSLERIAMRDEIKDGIWTKGDGETKDEDCKKESLSSKAVGVILSRYNQFFQPVTLCLKSGQIMSVHILECWCAQTSARYLNKDVITVLIKKIHYN